MKKLYRQISHFFARRTLKRNLLNRLVPRQTVMFSDAHTIGVLFVAHAQSDIDTAHQYIQDLEKKGKQVSYIGLIDIKDYKKTHKDTSINPNYIFSNDFDFFHRPKMAAIKSFYKQNFDMLISLNYSNQFSLNYISSLSRAKLRIGKFNTNAVAAFDFMIDDKGDQMQTFIDQLNHYLQQLKK